MKSEFGKTPPKQEVRQSIGENSDPVTRPIGSISRPHLDLPATPLDSEIVYETGGAARKALGQFIRKTEYSLDMLDAAKRKEAMLPFIGEVVQNVEDSRLASVTLAARLEEERIEEAVFQKELRDKDQSFGGKLEDRWLNFKSRKSVPPQPVVERYTREGSVDGSTIAVTYHIEEVMVNGELVKCTVPDRFEQDFEHNSGFLGGTTTSALYTVTFEGGFVDGLKEENMYLGKQTEVMNDFLLPFAEGRDNPSATLEFTDLQTDPKLRVSVKTVRDKSWSFGENFVRFNSVDYSFDPSANVFQAKREDDGEIVGEQQEFQAPPLDPNLFLAMLKGRLERVPTV